MNIYSGCLHFKLANLLNGRSEIQFLAWVVPTMQLLRVGNFGRFPGGTICRKEYVLVKILRTSREPLNPEDSKVHKRT